MKKTKSLEEQEQALQSKIIALEAKKKALAKKRDARRTKTLILLGTVMERTLSESSKNHDYYMEKAKQMYHKRPTDLAILHEAISKHMRDNTPSPSSEKE